MDKKYTFIFTRSNEETLEFNNITHLVYSCNGRTQNIANENIASYIYQFMDKFGMIATYNLFSGVENKGAVYCKDVIAIRPIIEEVVDITSEIFDMN